MSTRARPAQGVGGSMRAWDDPEAYIPGDRRRALAAGEAMPDRVTGAALSADISGFTRLTEALTGALGPQRGAEELTTVLETVLGTVLDELHRFGGSAIYFSGDAITCWLDGDDGQLGIACALAMQEALDRVGLIVTASGEEVRLAMKIAVAVGTARRFVVGDPSVQLIDVLAGSLMDHLAAAEHVGRQGEVVVDQSVIAALGSRLELSGDRASGDPSRRAGVVGRLAFEVSLPPPEPPRQRLPEQVVRQWLLPAVYDRMRSGRGEFLAELRSGIPLFVRFGGIDFDGDDQAPDKLQDFVVRAQRIIDEYGGSTLQLTVGDKGAYLYAVFGSPRAHEDDAARVCATALDLLALEASTAVRGLRLGISQGRLRSGTYGHRERRTFCCLGDPVNVAARLMVAAPAGGVYVTAPVQAAAGAAFAFAALPPLRLKGKALEVTAYNLMGRATRSSPVRTGERQRLVGRDDELRQLEQLAQRVRDGRGHVVGVCAEAGMGKSRLVAELAAGVGTRGMRVAEGAAQAYGVSASYAAWREVGRTLLGIVGEPSAPELTELLREALPVELAPRSPLLGTLLGTPLPDNELTATFDAKLRKTSLESLAVQLLIGLARREPLLIVLEDCHRLDPLSRDLVIAVARACAESPLLLALAYRTGDGAFASLGLEPLSHARELRLRPLDAAATAHVVTHQLALLFGASTAFPQALVQFLADRSEGNPLYVRELCAFVRASSLDLQDARAVADLDIPESLQSLVLGRIDRLAESPRRTAKVASVVGRSFGEALLPTAYPELGSVDGVHADLQRLAAHDVVAPEEPGSASYEFTHAITCEVAYESIPYALRAEIHEGVARALETGADGGQLDRLAHHYWHGADLAKKQEYQLRAGIAAQASFANSSAVTYFQRVIPLLPEEERAPVLNRLGKMLELTGDWVHADDAYREARALATRHGDLTSAAWSRTWTAEVARRQGRYDDAEAGLADAAREFEALGDDAGVGQVLHVAGTLAAQRGDYDRATDTYTESLRIRERLGDRPNMAAVLSNLAIVAEYRGDYDAAAQLNEQSLALRLQVGDKWAIGISQNNLGMIAALRGDHRAATARFVEAMRLHREVGDTWMVGLIHNNLGNAHRGLAEHTAAGLEYAAALRTYRAYEDEWALAILYEDVAQLAAATGDAENAVRLVGAADATREHLGSPRAPDVQAQLDRSVEPLLVALGARFEPLREAGRRLTGADAHACVLAVCSPGAE